MTRFKRVKDTIKPSNIIKALKDHSNRTFRLAAEKVQPSTHETKRRGADRYSVHRVSIEIKKKKERKKERKETENRLLRNLEEEIIIFVRVAIISR